MKPKEWSLSQSTSIHKEKVFTKFLNSKIEVWDLLKMLMKKAALPDSMIDEIWVN